ncbi:hypothetical protein DL93DRAFT_1785286 [Clavulina sp. PMI_390]|nr:hypothetical protein DL93DRAFT_1785286 [Clavulina sp. PMI_390]
MQSFLFSAADYPCTVIYVISSPLPLPHSLLSSWDCTPQIISIRSERRIVACALALNRYRWGSQLLAPPAPSRVPAKIVDILYFTMWSLLLCLSAQHVFSWRFTKFLLSRCTGREYLPHFAARDRQYTSSLFGCRKLPTHSWPQDQQYQRKRSTVQYSSHVFAHYTKGRRGYQVLLL